MLKVYPLFFLAISLSKVASYHKVTKGHIICVIFSMDHSMRVKHVLRLVLLTQVCIDVTVGVQLK